MISHYAILKERSAVVSSCKPQASDNTYDIAFKDEIFAGSNSLIDAMSPLLARMKLFGLYFMPENDDGGDKAGNSASSLNLQKDSIVGWKGKPNGKPNQFGRKVHRLYSIVVLTLLWGNALRFFTVFNDGTSFDAILLSKLTNLSWMWLCAINQTSMFYACKSGRLHRILRSVSHKKTAY